MLTNTIELITIKYIIMNIINKITGRNITAEYLGLMMGIITNDEFEMITMSPSK